MKRGSKSANPAIDWILRHSTPAPPPPSARSEREWLSDFRLPLEEFEQLMIGLVEKLIAMGVPLWRCSTTLLPLHPDVFARRILWTRDHGCRVFDLSHEFVSSVAPGVTAVFDIKAGSDTIRRRLDVPKEQIPWAELQDMSDQGGTDYIVMPLMFSDGRRSSFSCATDRPGGFTENDLELLEETALPLALRVELASAHIATSSLLNVYLGPNAAKRVLTGAFRRGGGELVEAVIWYCDLRGFTSLVDARPVADVVPILDRYFESVAGPVSDNGGEILKFIGDAMLAVFRIEPNMPTDEPCARALAAAETALAALTELNVTLDTSLAIGVALHVGEVMYGNIGARNRLDFTVIGRAVNEACRVEALCKELGVALLVTSSFVAAHPASGVVSLGDYTLRGVARPHELFTLPRLLPART
jgi:adenylate cyclase